MNSADKAIEVLSRIRQGYLDDDEPVKARVITQAVEELCTYCIDTKGQMAPRHFASDRCKSNKYAHCTCDTCF